ncbi:MAG TPA: YceI family protein, partial [Flavobacteriales bacterium]|nr:YceI family protein [Flavobacteriales bacterium]
MKNVLLLAGAFALVSVGTTSCGDDHSAAVADSTATVMHYTIDPATSKLTWSGTAIGIKTHTGNLNFASGSFSTDKGLLTAGEFVVDMKNYTMTDTNYAPDGSEQGTKANLMGHLMSPDFFAVDSFPTAMLRIVSVTGNSAT